jgi:hypothetical protein
VSGRLPDKTCCVFAIFLIADKTLSDDGAFVWFMELAGLMLKRLRVKREHIWPDGATQPNGGRECQWPWQSIASCHLNVHLTVRGRRSYHERVDPITERCADDSLRSVIN